uniref:Uncharacterized protein n=1 Tax=Meloidogyne enterolobii TaxID=390850 RepID=A0A6V7UDW6_MELEN|nr:unnamed protein product [Meloidogyne enterolobii]
MESTPQQNKNQYCLPQPFTAYPMMNFPTNNQQRGQMYIQNYGVPNLFFGCPTAFSHQMMYSPYPLFPPQPTTQIEQNVNFVNENFSQSNIEKLLLETIPDLDGTEESFGIKKFFKKFDAHLEDWPEKKKIFALKSKLYGKAKSYFVLAIKAKLYNYKSIKNFILCQLIPSEYKVEEPIDPIKKKTNSKFEQLKKNCEENEKLLPQPKSQNFRPQFSNRISIPFEKVSYPSEVLEFFEGPPKNEPKERKKVKPFEKAEKLEILVPTNCKIKKTIKAEFEKKASVLDLGEPDFEFPLNLFEDEKEFKMVEDLKNPTPTILPKKTIKEESREENLVLGF